MLTPEYKGYEVLPGRVSKREVWPKSNHSFFVSKTENGLELR